ncbi:hypothetical protein MNBD_ALPHA07-2147 [hydrothermal vent metagenome]|uniref:Lipoprotein n=1 Tax=hydrothermal vent metagenome TaxID=652676 RepID=A0A3B0RMH2_9ZZZZ
MIGRRTFLALTLTGALTLSACGASAPEEVSGANIVSRGYMVKTVNLSMTDTATINKGLYKENPELVTQLQTRLKAELVQKTRAVRGGNKPAIVSVKLTNVRIASAAGRALVAADTYLVGDVVVTDVAGNVLASQAGVRFEDKASKKTSTFNGIPIGALINTVTNAESASDEQRIARLSTGFTNEIVGWLGR